MAKSFGEALAKGEPVVMTFKDRIPKILYREGDEKRALELLAAKGIIELQWILPGTKLEDDNPPARLRREGLQGREGTMKNELVNGKRVKCYDNGGRSMDRYTVVYLDEPYQYYNGVKGYCCLGMSASPFHPQGFGQHLSCVVGRHLGKRILFKDLPEDCQKAVKQDCEECEKNGGIAV